MVQKKKRIYYHCILRAYILPSLPSESSGADASPWLPSSLLGASAPCSPAAGTIYLICHCKHTGDPQGFPTTWVEKWRRVGSALGMQSIT